MEPAGGLTDPLDKPFICETCPKRYLRKANLEDHVLMEHPHTDQAADIVTHKARNGRSKASLIVECDICQKRFRYQSDLKNHVESHFRASSKRGRSTAASLNGHNNSTPNRYTSGNGPVGISRSGGKTTRPCLYCGVKFQDQESLLRHESAEAIEFEREASRFETDDWQDERRMTHVEFEERNNFHRVIDRTDEEFGDDEENSLDTHVSSSYGRSPRSVSELPGVTGLGQMIHFLPSPQLHNSSNGHYYEGEPHSTPSHNGGSCRSLSYEDSVHQPPQFNDAPSSPVPQHSPTEPPYHPKYNHTSQYASCDPAGYPYSLPMIAPGSPRPAHADQTTAHGFLPPPPALPVPEFTQVCHRRSEAEFPDPNEERTYTTLQSKDETHTSSLLHVNSMSPSREVLDLSMPKEGEGIEAKTEDEVDSADTNGHQDEEVSTSNEALDFSIKPVETSSNDENKVDVTIEPIEKPEEEEIEDNKKVDDDTENVSFEKKVEDDTETVSFEPSSMPSMPEANIALKPDNSQNGLTEQEWREFEDYSGLLDEDEFEAFEASSPAVQFDDPSRIDCKYCGMIFKDGHVRKFHEQSHMEIEEDYDDGELTRLFCGFCGKTFTNSKYRMIHEKSHTGELPVSCPHCRKRFRWESELRSHNKLYCTAEKPCRSRSRNFPGSSKKNRNPEAKSRPRLVDQEGWEPSHTLPEGWKMKTRPRPAQEGQRYYIFMSKDGQVIHSRKAVLQQMEKEGTYTEEDFARVKQLARPGPRASEQIQVAKLAKICEKEERKKEEMLAKNAEKLGRRAEKMERKAEKLEKLAQIAKLDGIIKRGPGRPKLGPGRPKLGPGRPKLGPGRSKLKLKRGPGRPRLNKINEFNKIDEFGLTFEDYNDSSNMDMEEDDSDFEGKEGKKRLRRRPKKSQHKKRIKAKA